MKTDSGTVELVEDEPDTEPHPFGPSPDDAVTPRVIVQHPDDPYLRGVVEALNETYRYVREKVQVAGPDGPRPISDAEAAQLVYAIRERLGI